MLLQIQDASAWLGKRFHVKKGCDNKVDFNGTCPIGTIHAVVRRKGDSEKTLYYRIYNHTAYRRAPPANVCDYATVASFVSNDKKKCFVEVEKEKQTPIPRAPRVKKRTWAYVTEYEDDQSE